MAARFRGNRMRGVRRGSRPARAMDWHGAIHTSAGAIGPGTRSVGWTILPLDIRDLYTDPTWIRSIMSTAVRVVVSPAGHSVVAVGLIAWNSRDDALPTAPPGPSSASDSDADWVLRQPIAIPANTGVGTIFTVSADMMLDSRAMRRLGNDRAPLWVAEHYSFGASGTVDVVSDVRLLLKE